MDAAISGDERLSGDANRDSSRERSDQQVNTPNSEDKKGEENKFQRAISAWRSLDLTNLVPSLDDIAAEIETHRKDSLVQRKELAQKTKEFRKLGDAEKLSEYKGLLKGSTYSPALRDMLTSIIAYQSFIDLITNHGKTSSSIFFQLYSSLSEVPDPYPLLEASVDSLLISEDTLPKLTAEKNQLQRSVNRLTTQLENTEKKLEEERAARKKLEDSQETKIKEVEASWTAVIQEKKDNWEAKERSLEEKVENQDRLINEIKASYEVSQRLNHGDDEHGNVSRATTAELDMLNSDLERTNLRLAEVEARNEQLRLELAQAASHSQNDYKSASVEDDPLFLRLQSENSSILRKLDALRLEKDTEKNGWESRMRQLERSISQLNSDREELRSKLQKRSDYDEVKRELEVLKAIELSTGNEADSSDDEDGQNSSIDMSTNVNGAAAKGKNESLEQLLLARNKKLSNELTLLRVSHQELRQRLESMQEDLSKTHAELEKSQNLSSTLENDLLKVQQEASNALPSSGASVAGTYTSRYPQSALGYGSLRRGRTSPTSSIISGFDPRNSSSPGLTTEGVGGGSGILPMVQAQRDRFKQKNSQLEEELAKSVQTVSTLRQEVSSLQKDNLSLYEKTRYVSTYNRGQAGTSSSASAYSHNPNPGNIHATSNNSSGLSMDRYRSAYEANISPFAAFRGRESARAYKRMSLPERIVFSITRMVLANRTSRNLFAGYCLALHILVFWMLYWMGSVDIEKHSSNLGEVAAAAAAAGGSIGTNPGADSHHGDWHQEGFNGDDSM
ncbi:MAG: Cut-like homeobox [Cirrosporium novae-zelandiae]|nr:MAG: Cut-like homeobox [Cirrosporium novae-zelandiae]